MVVRLPDALGEGGDLPDGLALVHQAIEAVLARGAAAADLRLHRAEPRRQLREPGAREAVTPVESLLQHASVCQLHQGISTVSPSYAGLTPSGSPASSSACPVSCVR